MQSFNKEHSNALIMRCYEILTWYKVCLRLKSAIMCGTIYWYMKEDTVWGILDIVWVALHSHDLIALYIISRQQSKFWFQRVGGNLRFSKSWTQWIFVISCNRLLSGLCLFVRILSKEQPIFEIRQSALAICQQSCVKFTYDVWMIHASIWRQVCSQCH